MIQDSALVRFAREFDKANVTTDRLRASDEDFTHAFNSLEPEVIRAIEFAVDGIRRFHEEQKPEAMWLHEIPSQSSLVSS